MLTTTETKTGKKARKQPVRGDGEAQALYDANRKLVFWALRRRRCPERLAEDAEAAASWVLWRACQLYEEGKGCRFSTYACRALLWAVGRVMGREIRRAARQVPWDDAFPFSPPAAPAPPPAPDEAGDLAAARRAVLPAMTPRERQVVVLMAEEGLRRCEVARRLGISQTRVGMLLRAVRFRAGKAKGDPAPRVDDGAYSVKQAARLLGLEPDVVRGKCRRLGLACEKMRDGYRITHEQLPLLARRQRSADPAAALEAFLARNPSNSPGQGQGPMNDATTTDATPRKDFLTSEQVAERLAVSRRTLWRLVAAGEFPQPVRFNRHLVRWAAADVEKYVRESGDRRHVPRPPPAAAPGSATTTETPCVVDVPDGAVFVTWTM